MFAFVFRLEPSELVLEHSPVVLGPVLAVSDMREVLGCAWVASQHHNPGSRASCVPTSLRRKETLCCPGTGALSGAEHALSVRSTPSSTSTTHV